MTPVAALFVRVGTKGRFGPEGRKTLTQDIVGPNKDPVSSVIGTPDGTRELIVEVAA